MRFGGSLKRIAWSNSNRLSAAAVVGGGGASMTPSAAPMHAENFTTRNKATRFGGRQFEVLNFGTTYDTKAIKTHIDLDVPEAQQEEAQVGYHASDPARIKPKDIVPANYTSIKRLKPKSAKVESVVTFSTIWYMSGIAYRAKVDTPGKNPLLIGPRDPVTQQLMSMKTVASKAFLHVGYSGKTKPDGAQAFGFRCNAVQQRLRALRRKQHPHKPGAGGNRLGVTPLSMDSWNMSNVANCAWDVYIYLKEEAQFSEDLWSSKISGSLAQINFAYIPGENEARERGDPIKRPSVEVSSIPGVRSHFMFRVLGKDTLGEFFLSCYCEACLAGWFEQCEEKETIGPMVTIKSVCTSNYAAGLARNNKQGLVLANDLSERVPAAHGHWCAFTDLYHTTPTIPYHNPNFAAVIHANLVVVDST